MMVDYFTFTGEGDLFSMMGEKAMRYTGKRNCSAQEISSQTELLKALEDTDREFSRDELTRIINNQFFNDELPLDVDVVDAAVVRMLLLDGVTLNEMTLQRERERMIYGILKNILKSEA